MRRPLLLLAAACAVLLAGCGSGGEDGRPTVVATTTQAADLARGVAGDRARVRGILAPNSDPHDYEVRPGDVKARARRSGGARAAASTRGSAARSTPPAPTRRSSTCSTPSAPRATTRTGGRTRAAPRPR